MCFEAARLSSRWRRNSAITPPWYRSAGVRRIGGRVIRARDELDRLVSEPSELRVDRAPDAAQLELEELIVVSSQRRPPASAVIFTELNGGNQGATVLGRFVSFVCLCSFRVPASGRLPQGFDANFANKGQLNSPKLAQLASQPWRLEITVGDGVRSPSLVTPAPTQPSPWRLP